MLAVRQDNNGDVALIGPAIRALATRADVVLVCAPSGIGAAHLLPGVKRVIVARAEWIDGHPRPLEPSSVQHYVEEIRAAQVEEAFVFTSFHQSPLPAALLLRLAGVPKIHAICEDYPGSLLDTRLQLNGERHESERALELVGALGYALPSGDDGRLSFRELSERRTIEGRYIAVQPGASVPARAWAPSRLREVVRRLTDLGVQAVIVGSADENPLTKYVAGDTGALNLAGLTTFAQFAAVVRDAEGARGGQHLRHSRCFCRGDADRRHLSPDDSSGSLRAVEGSARITRMAGHPRRRMPGPRRPRAGATVHGRARSLRDPRRPS